MFCAGKIVKVFVDRGIYLTNIKISLKQLYIEICSMTFQKAINLITLFPVFKDFHLLDLNTEIKSG